MCPIVEISQAFLQLIHIYLCLIDSLHCNFQRLSHFTSKRVWSHSGSIYLVERTHFMLIIQRLTQSQKKKRNFFYLTVGHFREILTHKKRCFNSTNEKNDWQSLTDQNKNHVFHTWITFCDVQVIRWIKHIFFWVETSFGGFIFNILVSISVEKHVEKKSRTLWF